MSENTNTPIVVGLIAAAALGLGGVALLVHKGRSAAAVHAFGNDAEWRAKANAELAKEGLRLAAAATEPGWYYHVTVDGENVKCWVTDLPVPKAKWHNEPVPKGWLDGSEARDWDPKHVQWNADHTMFRVVD